MRANATPQLEASSSAHDPTDNRSGASPWGGCPLLPTEDRVILKDAPLEAYSGLLVVPDKPSFRGTVIAVGPDVLDLQVGDVVQYRPFVGSRIEVDGLSWMLVREEECLCRIG